MTIPVKSAQIVVPCRQFDATFAALTEHLGFRVDTIFPADAPTTAVVSGFGVTLCLESSSPARAEAPIVLRLAAGQPQTRIALPDLAIEWVPEAAPMAIPQGKQQFIITRMNDADKWVGGRAGMQYRELIPGRFGGRFIGSHIRIADGGPVSDYVHFHNVRFQMIFCRAGWVRVVYEDQGDPFVLHAGDCVLQPPEIRHRVLEASTGLEVIELGCPAIHETHADHQMALPNLSVRRSREFAGQRFVRHVASEASAASWTWMGLATSGFASRDIGINAATAALAGAQVVQVLRNGATTPPASHDGELLFLFVLAGQLQLQSPSLGNHTLQDGDCATIPAGAVISLCGSAATEFLEVAIPAL